VFAGGFDLPAAVVVCSGAGIAPGAVPDLVAGLVDKSILTPDGTRYRMLETIRQYGWHRAADIHPELRIRHRDHYLEFALRGERDWLLGTEQHAVFTRTRAEQANLRAALEFCLTTPGEAATGLRLGAALPYHWLFSGWVAEGRYWLGRALEQNPEPSRDRATALWITSYALCLMGFYDAGLPFAREAEEWALAADDEVVLGYARLVLGGCAFLGGEFDRATELFQDIADRQQRSGHYTSALFLSYLTVGQSEVWGGRPDVGISVASHALALCEQTGEYWARTHLYYCLGLGYWKKSDWHAAEECLRRGLRIAEAFNDVIAVAQQLEILTAVVAAAGRCERAAELLGVGSRVWPLAGGEPYLSFQAMIDTHHASERATRLSLGPLYDQAFARGVAQAATVSQAVAYILGDPVVVERSVLTEREHQVADLVARGLTNREIAAQLVISPRTAETHVNRVLGKLGLTSRTQLAARLAEDRHDA
jgi:non-specific serine/threonine protein kinase